MAWEGTDSLTMEQAFNIFTGTDQGARGHSWDSDTWRTQTTRDMGEAIRDAGSALEQRFASATYHPLALEAAQITRFGEELIGNPEGYRLSSEDYQRFITLMAQLAAGAIDKLR